jgi:hypothetical protein
MEKDQCTVNDVLKRDGKISTNDFFKIIHADPRGMEIIYPG